MAKLNFHQSLLQSSVSRWSFRNFVKKHLIVLSVLQLMLNILVETKKKNVQENLKLQVLLLIQLIRCPGQIPSTGPCQSWPPKHPHPLDWLYDSLSSPPVAGVWWVHWRRCIVAAVTSSKWMLHTGGGWGETPPMIVKHFGCTTIHNKALYKCIIHSLQSFSNILNVTFDPKNLRSS